MVSKAATHHPNLFSKFLFTNFPVSEKTKYRDFHRFDLLFTEALLITVLAGRMMRNEKSGFLLKSFANNDCIGFPQFVNILFYPIFAVQKTNI
jgi:hypothetical protein